MRIFNQQRAIELLALLTTVFGSWVVGTLVFEFVGSMTLEGHRLLYIQSSFFIVWFFLIAIVTAIAHPRASALVLLYIGGIAAAVLVLISQGWTNPDLGLIEKSLTWLEVYFHFLIAPPIFYAVGHFASSRNA